MLAWLLLLSSASAGRIDLNQASLHELDSLPGLGRSKAAAIIAHREAHGPYTRLDDLLEVSGIGPGTVRSLEGYVTIGDKVLASAHSRPPANEAQHPVVPSAVAVDPNDATIVELADSDFIPGVVGGGFHCRRGGVVADAARRRIR